MSDKNKPVILQILPSLESGGVERGAVELGKELAKKNYISIIASSGGKMVEYLSEDITHIELPLESKNPVNIWNNISEITEIIKKYDVDIVHARSRAPAWSAYYAAKKTNRKFITTVHGPYSIGNSLKKKYNSVMMKGDKIIAVSEFIKNYILDNYNIKENKVKVIHRGVDIEEFDPEKVSHGRVLNKYRKLDISKKVPTILMPGRFTSWKGHEFLIDALSLIKDQEFQCIFIGKASKHPKYLERLKDKIKKNGLENKIYIKEPLNDMPAIYLASDIIISASTRPEAFGRIATEAQAMGKILIATNHGGSCETVIDNESGFLVENENISQLSEKITQALQISETQKENMGKKAIENIRDNFSLDKMIEETISVYNDIL